MSTLGPFNPRKFLEGFIVGIAITYIGVWLVSLIATRAKIAVYNKLFDQKDLKNSQLLAIGIFCLVLGIILNKFNIENVFVCIATFLLYASSIVCNTVYLVQWKKNKSKNINQNSDNEFINK